MEVKGKRGEKGEVGGGMEGEKKIKERGRSEKGSDCVGDWGVERGILVEKRGEGDGRSSEEEGRGERR